MNNMDQELANLFVEYRQAAQVPDASSDFMPRLWRSIDTKRAMTRRVRRFTQLMVGAAVTACATIAFYLSTTPVARATENPNTYAEVLAAAHPAEPLLELGLAPAEAR